MLIIPLIASFSSSNRRKKEMNNVAPIRFLIEQYYDVQKLRVAAFNNIVAIVGTSHSKIEPQSDDASHSES